MNNTKRSVFLIAVWISVAGLLLVAAISTSVDANPLCPISSISQAQAEAAALAEAGVYGFAGPSILSSELLTADEADAMHRINLARPVDCVWFISMSGSKPDRFESGKQLVEMHVALDSVTAELNAGRLMQAPVLGDSTTTPLPTPTVGPSSTPTASPAPPVTPTP